MSGKMSSIIVPMIGMSLLIAGCSAPATSVPTASLPPTVTATTVPTRAPTPSPAPTLTADEMFQEMSADWRVAYYDELSNQLCAMYVDGKNTLCLNYDAWRLPGGGNSGSWSPDGSRFAIPGFSGIYIWEFGGGVTNFREGPEEGPEA